MPTQVKTTAQGRLVHYGLRSRARYPQVHVVPFALPGGIVLVQVIVQQGICKDFFLKGIFGKKSINPKSIPLDLLLNRILGCLPWPLYIQTIVGSKTTRTLGWKLSHQHGCTRKEKERGEEF